MKRFDKQVVWITGASSGLGAALAEAFAREGAQLVLSARRKDELDRLASKLDGKPLVVPLDLAQSETFPPLVEEVLERFGRVDVMVHNAGISQRAPAEATQLHVDRRVMEVNYFGTVALTKALLPSMRAARAGHFVVVSSVMGKIGTPHRSAYAASKHALHGFFDCLRAEVSDDGLFVTLICPGYVRTNVSRNALTGDGSANNTLDNEVAKGHPANRTAWQVLDAVFAKRSETYVGAFGKERLSLLLQRWAPRTLERMVRGEVPE